MKLRTAPSKDDVKIEMLKPCGVALIKTISILYNKCLEEMFSKTVHAVLYCYKFKHQMPISLLSLLYKLYINITSSIGLLDLPQKLNAQITNIFV